MRKQHTLTALLFAATCFESGDFKTASRLVKFAHNLMGNNPYFMPTTSEQILELEKKLADLRIDRLNAGAKIAHCQEEIRLIDKNIFATRVNLEALKTLESLQDV